MRHQGKSAAPQRPRRDFLRLTGAGIAGYALSPAAYGFKTVYAREANTRNTARMCIFIFAQGGMSHLDTFDIKEGKWTPDRFDVVTSHVQLPRGLFPKLAAPPISKHLSIVRSLSAWTEAHGTGEYWTFTNQEFHPSLVKERPHVGSVVALEYAGRRRAADGLPAFVALNDTLARPPANRRLGNGFLPARHAPYYATADPAGLSGSGGDLTRPSDADTIRVRPAADPPPSADRLRPMDRSPAGKPPAEEKDTSNAGKRMLGSPVAERAFKFSAADRDRYGHTAFGNSCIVARNLAQADAGTAFVLISGIDWDHHENIYSRGLPSAGQTLDNGLANLIGDLATAPGRHPHKTALDETLIVVMGEFGRTPPSAYYQRYGIPTNPQGGRDHYKAAMSAAFIGGGVKGGRTIGATDEDGTRVIDRGWSGGGPTRPEDVYATIYSALGIDWSKTIADTPSGRVYRYTPLGNYGPIHELF